MNPEFKSKVAKILGTGLLIAGLVTATYFALDKAYDKLVIEPAGESVANFMDRMYGPSRY